MPAFVLATSASPCPFEWTTNLKMGVLSNDVVKLQQFLNADTSTAIALIGAGSPGMETTKFGGMTKKAVIAFQNKYAAEILVPNGLTQGSGIVGTATRAKLNSMCAKVSNSQSGAVLGASFTVADVLSIFVPIQPAQSIMPANALYVPFTNITLTAGSADVTVSSMTINRVGPGSDQVFADIDLNDSEGSVLSTAYFNSRHEAIFKDEFTIPAHTSMTLTVVGDAAGDLSGHDGEMPALQVTSIVASSPVEGSLPMRGTGQIANASLVIGSADATLSSYDPNNARIRYINDTNVTFSGIRINAGSGEAMRLDSITWEQNGTASMNDIANVVTVINGTTYPTVVEDGRSYTSIFPGGIIIPKGNSLELSVRGDLLTTGSNRTVQFDIHGGTDATLFGTTYGFGIALVPGGNTSTSGNSVFLTDTGDTDGASLTPFFSGSVVTISSGLPTYIGR